MGLKRMDGRRLGLGLVTFCFGAALLAQEPGGVDDSSRRFREAFAQATAAVAPHLERFSAHGEILVRVTKSAQLLDRPSPDQKKVLQEALAAIGEAEQLAVRSESSRELLKVLGLAVDRLRTELLNPGFTDMSRLSDDLHHSAVHAASGENRRNISSMNEVFFAMLRMQDALSGLGVQLAAVRQFPTERASVFANRSTERPSVASIRLVDPSNSVPTEFARYSHEISRIAARMARNREIAILTYGAMGDVATFQNAIGLSKAREKLKEADGKFVHGDADPDLRKPVAFALQRLETALLSPSSTDMEALREELHHAMVHPVEVVRLNDALETHRHLAVILDESQRAARTAAEVRAAEAAAIARELPSVRQTAGQRP